MSYKQALVDPTAVYDKPADVLEDAELSDFEKVKILDRWEYDARELQVAAEENMGGGSRDFLDEVLAAKSKLGMQSDEKAGNTKQNS